MTVRTPTITNQSALHDFQPQVRDWFERSVGQPTQIQCLAWPLIRAKEHVVLTAPTGSGKTMAAFLCSLDSLIADTQLLGKTRVLYISPLKALNNDIQQNLLAPLTQLKDCYESQAKQFPTINIMTRSGDTSQSDRRKMLRHPPEILITTPESLNLLLSTQSGRILLSDLQTVILDEVHAVIAGKRGAHLISAIERLPRLCGEFQRIALSATVKPIEVVADFIGGYRLTNNNPHNPRYEKRNVKWVKATNSKRYSLQVISALENRPDKNTATNRASNYTSDNEKEDFWHPLVERFTDIIANNQSTLLFTNSRRLCEKLTMKINRAIGDRIAYSHHGSLSKEIRSEVEKKLKNGELKAIVATNSLELGIDIGALDEVVMVQSPPSVSASIQRLGRAGHGVGQISHGRLFPTHPEDFVHAAALANAVHDQDIEEIHPIRCPLDVLAQVVISVSANETWDVDELFTQLRCSHTFHELPRHHFDLIIQMLAGRYADTRIRELKPRLSWDQMDNTIVATKGAVLALYMSGGTIPNRGYYQLRDANSNTLIGELDEEFVWEAAIGQVFTLGTQHWKVERITHNDVFVSPGSPKNSAPPFWIAESGQRDFHFSCRIGELLSRADHLLQSGNSEDQQLLLEALQQHHAMDSSAATTLITYLKKQREHTGVSLPHRYHIVVEHISSGPGGHTGHQLVLHTGWGGSVNRPLALALEAAWENTYGAGLKLYVDDDCIVVQLPQVVEASDVLSLVTQANLEPLLKKRLEGSGFFAARFRECAGRALLLTKTKFNQRLPLWMSRLQAQKLHTAVDKFTDFPILLESWRSCLQDEFDLPHCHQVLAELASGQISWSETFSATPSPFSHAVSWGQINQYMYMDDRSPDNTRSNLREDLLHDIVHSPALRPVITRAIKQQFEIKRQRLHPGYSPTSSRELLDWIKERVLLPIEQWQQLLIAVEKETNTSKEHFVEELSSRICLLTITDRKVRSTLVIAAEQLPLVLTGLYDVKLSGDLPKNIELTPLLPKLDLPEFNTQHSVEEPQWIATTLLTQWLGFYGPLPIDTVAKTLVIPIARLTAIVDDLIDNQSLVAGILLKDNEQQQICDAENFETLMRLQRAGATPSFVALPHQSLALFIAEQQGCLQTNESIDAVYNTLETLRNIFLPAPHWEQYILPARIKHYDPAWLDSLMLEGEFYWQGGAKQTISFLFDDERSLWLNNKNTNKLSPATDTANIDTANIHTTSIDATNIDTTNIDTDLLTILQKHTNGLDFSQLLAHFQQVSESHINSSSLSDAIWRLVWAGEISNDSYCALRKGIQNQFTITPIDSVGNSRNSRRNRPMRRSQYARRQSSLPYLGHWYSINPSISNEDKEEDLLEREENAKERARILLNRYGVVCRVLVKRENDMFSWNEIFRALRLMELSGEILAGQFFTGIPGPQFMSHQTFRRLQQPLPENAIFWINATDPASLCGIAVDSLKASLPKRIATTQLVYCGSELVLISEKSGKSLTFFIEPDDPRLPECFGLFHTRLERQFNPDKRITIATINEENANRSPYLSSLKLVFDIMFDHKQTFLQRRYTL